MARNKKAPGCFDRRGRGWRWRVCVGGHYHCFTIRTEQRTVAEAWARKKFDELNRARERQDDGLVVGVHMDTLLDTFERDALPLLARGTQATYRDSLKPIRTYFVGDNGTPPIIADSKSQPLPVERIRKGHVTGYLA